MTPVDPREVLSRPAHEPDAVLRYASHADGIIDVRLPAPGAAEPGGRCPVVVLLHGGFWRAAYDRVHTRPLADGLAALGATVVTPEFRRTGSPGGGWPGTFDDVAAALDALPGLLAPLDIDIDITPGVVLVGHSAGGHLALWAAGRKQLPTASRWRAARAYPIVGVVALAAVSDLTAAGEMQLDGGAAVDLIGALPANALDRYALADPMALLPFDTRVFIVHGTDDQQVPVDMSRDLAEAAERAGDPVRLRILEGVEHFALIDPLSAVWPEVRAAVAWAAGGD